MPNQRPSPPAHTPPLSSYPLRLAFFWTMQGLWAWVCLLPVTAAHAVARIGPRDAGVGLRLGPSLTLGLLLFGGGLLLESVADWQKFVWKSDPGERGSLVGGGSGRQQRTAAHSSRREHCASWPPSCPPNAANRGKFMGPVGVYKYRCCQCSCPALLALSHAAVARRPRAAMPPPPRPAPQPLPQLCGRDLRVVGAAGRCWAGRMACCAMGCRLAALHVPAASLRLRCVCACMGKVGGMGL